MVGIVLILFAQAQPSSELPGGYGASLLQAMVALLAVCALAWVTLRYLSKAGVGRQNGDRIRVVERVALDAQRQLYIVQVDDRQLLMGVGPDGAPALLSELDPSAAPGDAAATHVADGDRGAFADALRRLRGDATDAGDEPAA